MIRLELLELTKNLVRYRYYPESSQNYGVLCFYRSSGKFSIEKLNEEYGRWYALHALPYFKECQKKGFFDKQKTIAWF